MITAPSFTLKPPTLVAVTVAGVLLLTGIFFLVASSAVKAVFGKRVRGLPRTISLLKFREYYLKYREKTLRILHQQHGPWFGFEGTVVIGDAAIARKILLEPRHTVTRHPAYSDLSKANCSKSVGVLSWDSTDPRWPIHTRALQPVFHASNVAKYAPHIHAAVSRRAEQLVEARGTDLVVMMRAVAADVLMTWGYGLDPESPETAELHDLLIQDGETIARAASFRTTFDVSHIAFGQSLYKAIHAKLAPVWDRVLPASLRSHGAPQQSLNFTRSMHAASIPLEDIKAELVHIFGAHKAIGLIMALCLYELTRTPSRSTKDSLVVKRIRDECDSVLQGRPYADKADVSKLVYLRRVMDETTRMHPVAALPMRRIDELKLSEDITLPAGTRIGLSLEHLHFDPASWEEPEVFNPDRFLKKPVPGSFVPFLLGKRMCAGMPLAIFEFMCTMTSLLLRFDVEVPVDQLIKEPSIYTGVEALPFRLIPRV